MLIPCLERYRCLGSCKLEFHLPVLCKESRTSHPPACKARNRPLPQRALMWSKHAVSSGCIMKTHWRNATMVTTTIKTDNFLKCKEVEITVPRHKCFGPWDQNMPNFYGGIASGSNRKSYSRGLKSEQFSWMWTNRLRKSRHDRVTAGSQQSIKTQGDFLHLKDTKYHYNKHEGAHPSHRRLLFCQHCFALQTIILPQWFDLRRSKTEWTKETMKREEVTVCEKEREEDKKGTKNTNENKCWKYNRTTPRTTPERPPERPLIHELSSAGPRAIIDHNMKCGTPCATGPLLHPKPSNKENERPSHPSSKQAASKQQASQQASSKQQQEAASSSKQQQAAASSSKQRKQLASSSRQAAGKQQQASSSKQAATSVCPFERMNKYKL